MNEFILYSSSIILFDLLIRNLINNRLVTWYIIHAYCNLYVIAKCLPYILLFFNEPLKSLQNTEELNIHYYAVIPHIYHCIAFNLNYDDIFHHVLFVFFGVIFKLYCNVGITMAFYLFFINGLPGMIDYIMLSLYKFNRISKHTRHINALYLNSWFRCPGLIFSNSLFVFYILLNTNIFYTKILKILFSFVLWSYNGLYYNYQVRDSYIKSYQTKELQN